MTDALRGTSQAKIDAKGRLKVPSGFRQYIMKEYGKELFVTSLHGDSVRIYPLPIWVDIEQRLSRIPSAHPARQKYLDRVNYYGQTSELDMQGRVLIPARLRESAHIVGEVDVFGVVNYLDVWNHERFYAKLQREPFTDEDALALADLGI